MMRALALLYEKGILTGLFRRASGNKPALKISGILRQSNAVGQVALAPAGASVDGVFPGFFGESS
jgi:hypothetical protein